MQCLPVEGLRGSPTSKFLVICFYMCTPSENFYLSKMCSFLCFPYSNSRVRVAQSATATARTFKCSHFQLSTIMYTKLLSKSIEPYFPLYFFHMLTSLKKPLHLCTTFCSIPAYCSTSQPLLLQHNALVLKSMLLEVTLFSV